MTGLLLLIMAQGYESTHLARKYERQKLKGCIFGGHIFAPHAFKSLLLFLLLWQLIAIVKMRTTQDSAWVKLDS